MKLPMSLGWAAAAVLVLSLAVPGTARAHCDTLDGPVVVSARKALEAGDPTPVLRWVKADVEPGIRDAFRKTVEARKQGKAAREIADRWFLETLVRVHRAGEGAPYDGLKAGGDEVDPGLRAADRAVESGSVDALAEKLGHEAAEGIRQRYARLAQAKGHADHNVEAGRAWVAAYVDFIHHVERLHQAVAAPAHAHAERAEHAH